MKDFGRLKDSYEFSLDSRQLGLVILAAAAIAMLVFVLGVSVGRQWEKRVSGRQAAAGAVVVDEEPPAGEAPPEEAAEVPAAPPVEPPREEMARPEPTPAAEAPAEEANADLSDEDLTFPKVLTSSKGATAPLAARKREAKPGGFTIQVGAYKDRSSADSVAGRLGKKGYDARVLVSGSGGSRLFKVRVGSYATREEAGAVAGRLKAKEGVSPFVTAGN